MHSPRYIHIIPKLIGNEPVVYITNSALCARIALARGEFHLLFQSWPSSLVHHITIINAQVITTFTFSPNKRKKLKDKDMHTILFTEHKDITMKHYSEYL